MEILTIIAWTVLIVFFIWLYLFLGGAVTKLCLWVFDTTVSGVKRGNK